MKLGFTLAAVAVGTVSFAGVAEAASLGAAQEISFDFRGHGGLARGFYFEDDASGLSVEAAAGPNGSRVFQSVWGLGVRNSRFDTQGAQIDSFGTNESLFLTFSHAVSVNSIYLGAVDHNDDATITLDGETIFGNASIDPLLNASDGLDTTFAGNVLAFHVGDRRICDYHRCFSIQDRDDFTVKGVSVTKAVPEPLTVIGSVVALGLGSRLRRKSAS